MVYHVFGTYSAERYFAGNVSCTLDECRIINRDLVTYRSAVPTAEIYINIW